MFFNLQERLKATRKDNAIDVGPGMEPLDLSGGGGRGGAGAVKKWSWVGKNSLETKTLSLLLWRGMVWKRISGDRVSKRMADSHRIYHVWDDQRRSRSRQNHYILSEQETELPEVFWGSISSLSASVSPTLILVH